MKAMLKTTFALVLFLGTAVTAYAVVPDVNKWSCPAEAVRIYVSHGVQEAECYDAAGRLVNTYVKVSGELVYVHEHRVVNGKAVYYNALKANDGTWMEVVNAEDFVYGLDEADGGAVMFIVDDNENLVTKRFVPRLK